MRIGFYTWCRVFCLYNDCEYGSGKGCLWKRINVFRDYGFVRFFCSHAESMMSVYVVVLLAAGIFLKGLPSCEMSEIE